MTLIKRTGACVVLACGLASVLPSTVIASLQNPSAANVQLAAPFAGARAGKPPLQHEAEVLTSQGISPTRAIAAVNLQGAVARTDLISKVEVALGKGFAGVWFDNAAAKLHIGVTSPSGRELVERLAAREGLAAATVVTPVRSTWAELLNAQRSWHRRLAHLFAGNKVELALVARRNAVSITFSSAVPTTERTTIERDASAADVNVITSTSPQSRFSLTRATETKCLKFATTKKAYCEKPMTSGVEIQSAVNACTGGPMAIPVAAAEKNETYLLTAGHCLETGGGAGKSWYAFPEAGGTRKEIGKAAAGIVNNANGDYGEILIQRGGYWTEPLPTPVFALTAEWLLPEEEKSHPVRNQRKTSEGNLDCYEGATSGEGCGEVKRAFVEIGLVKGIAESLLSSGGIEGGDSGGPVMFVETNKESLMEGTVIGYVEPNNKRMTFEPLSTILEHYNQELLITANEVRPAALLLPEKAKFTFKSSTGENTRLETLAGKKIECKKVTGSGEATSARLGSLELKMTECEEPGLKVKCTGLSDTTGNITIKGAEFHLRHLLPGSEGMDFLILVGSIHFSCSIVLFTVSGCTASMDILTKSGGENAVNKLLASLFVNFLQEKGDTKPVSVDTDGALAMENCELKSKEGSGANESAGQLGAGTIEACKVAVECTFLLDLSGTF